MKKIILFCFLVLLAAPPVFSEMIPLQCDVKETMSYMPSGIKEVSTRPWHFVIDTTNKKVYYINGGAHQLFDTVEISDKVIKMNIFNLSKTSVTSGEAYINRYTGIIYGRYQEKTIKKTYHDLPYNYINLFEGSCRPYVVQKKF